MSEPRVVSAKISTTPDLSPDARVALLGELLAASAVEVWERVGKPGLEDIGTICWCSLTVEPARWSCGCPGCNPGQDE